MGQLEKGGPENDKHAFHGTILPFSLTIAVVQAAKKKLQKCNDPFLSYSA
jgi:hypothetical protein